MLKLLNYLFLITVGVLSQFSSLSQQPDSLYIKDTVRVVVNRYQNLSFSGYIQPQFQQAEEKGISSFEGGNFQKHSDNRFMLRRSRMKIEYNLTTKTSLQPKALFSFQIDATERGVSVRDAFIRWYGPGKRSVSLTAGLFNRPFGSESITSSSVRESPERGRGSQILVPGEKDLGVMLSLDPKKKFWENFRFDIGLLNGQGTSGPTDYDTYKDIAWRLMLKKISLGKSFSMTGGLSVLWGGWVQETKYVYEVGEGVTGKTFLVDSSTSNIGARAPRRYNGYDLQLRWDHGIGKTEIRGEYWKGKQSGSSTSTTTPGTLQTSPVYIREFDAAFLYFVQSIVKDKWEAVIKYDWYDPNKKVEGLQPGFSGTGFTGADIKYSTLGIGITRYITGNLKVLGYYAMVKNEETAVTDFTTDIEDNVFTLRMQLRF